MRDRTVYVIRVKPMGLGAAFWVTRAMAHELPQPILADLIEHRIWDGIEALLWEYAPMLAAG